MSLLSNEEIGKITEQCQGPDWSYQLVLKTEAAILSRLKSQKPVAWLHHISDNNDVEQCIVDFEPTHGMSVHEGDLPLHMLPVPASDKEEDAARYQWLRDHPEFYASQYTGTKTKKVKFVCRKHFTNYPYELFDSLDEAVDAARRENP